MPTPFSLRAVAVPALSALLLCAAPGAHAGPADTARTAAWFDAQRLRPTQLRQFLQRLPKGADLHSHLSGAVYAETYLAWAAEDDLCVHTDSLAFSRSCTVGDERQVPARQLQDSPHLATYQALVDHLSMRNLASSRRPGHDQFFDAFAAIPPVGRGVARQAAMAAELADRAAQQATLHLELMVTFQGSAVRELGNRLPWADETDLARRLEALKHPAPAAPGAAAPTQAGAAAPTEPGASAITNAGASATTNAGAAAPRGVAALVEAGRADLDALDAALRQQLACGSAAAHPGCSVSIRWLQQTTRTAAPEAVFAQLAYAFALASADERVAGINLVAPEDHPVALRDYHLQMQMIGFLHAQYPAVKIALHAGELALGLVPPQHLRSHIREAVALAGAHRIGHAVALFHEDDAAGTLALMKARGVAAEICLSSNDGILGIKGNDHPLPDYLAAGVPVVLASDDEGISRIDLSHEYLRAATTYGLRYRTLKQLSRNSLEYSFLPGASLWHDAAAGRPVAACRRDALGGPQPGAACQAWLAGSARAARQWALEAAFEAFEQLPEWRGRPAAAAPSRR